MINEVPSETIEINYGERVDLNRPGLTGEALKQMMQNVCGNLYYSHLAECIANEVLSELENVPYYTQVVILKTIFTIMKYVEHTDRVGF